MAVYHLPCPEEMKVSVVKHVCVCVCVCVCTRLHTQRISIHIFWHGGKWRTACLLSYSRTADVWPGEYSYCIIHLWFDSCTVLSNVTTVQKANSGKLEISWKRTSWMSCVSIGAHLPVLWFSMWTEAVRNLVEKTQQRLICSTEIL